MEVRLVYSTLCTLLETCGKIYGMNEVLQEKIAAFGDKHLNDVFNISLFLTAVSAFGNCSFLS